MRVPLRSLPVLAIACAFVLASSAPAAAVIVGGCTAQGTASKSTGVDVTSATEWHLRTDDVVSGSGAAPYLVLDLPAAPTAKTWEAWVVRGDTPLAAGITNDRGVMTLVLTVGIASGDTVAVTLEPSGGLDRPTGKPVLAGKT